MSEEEEKKDPKPVEKKPEEKKPEPLLLDSANDYTKLYYYVAAIRELTLGSGPNIDKIRNDINGREMLGKMSSPPSIRQCHEILSTFGEFFGVTVPGKKDKDRMDALSRYYHHAKKISKNGNFPTTSDVTAARQEYDRAIDQKEIDAKALVKDAQEKFKASDKALSKSTRKVFTRGLGVFGALAVTGVAVAAFLGGIGLVATTLPLGFSWMSGVGAAIVVGGSLVYKTIKGALGNLLGKAFKSFKTAREERAKIKEAQREAKQHLKASTKEANSVDYRLAADKAVSELNPYPDSSYERGSLKDKSSEKSFDEDLENVFVDNITPKEKENEEIRKKINNSIKSEEHEEESVDEEENLKLDNVPNGGVDPNGGNPKVNPGKGNEEPEPEVKKRDDQEDDVVSGATAVKQGAKIKEKVNGEDGVEDNPNNVTPVKVNNKPKINEEDSQQHITGEENNAHSEDTYYANIDGDKNNTPEFTNEAYAKFLGEILKDTYGHLNGYCVYYKFNFDKALEIHKSVVIDKVRGLLGENSEKFKDEEIVELYKDFTTYEGIKNQLLEKLKEKDEPIDLADIHAKRADELAEKLGNDFSDSYGTDISNSYKTLDKQVEFCRDLVDNYDEYMNILNNDIGKAKKSADEKRYPLGEIYSKMTDAQKRKIEVLEVRELKDKYKGLVGDSKLLGSYFEDSKKWLDKYAEYTAERLAAIVIDDAEDKSLMEKIYTENRENIIKELREGKKPDDVAAEVKQAYDERKNPQPKVEEKDEDKNKPGKKEQRKNKTKPFKEEDYLNFIKGGRDDAMQLKYYCNISDPKIDYKQAYEIHVMYITLKLREELRSLGIEATDEEIKQCYDDGNAVEDMSTIIAGSHIAKAEEEKNKQQEEASLEEKYQEIYNALEDMVDDKNLMVKILKERKAKILAALKEGKKGDDIAEDLLEVYNKETSKLNGDELGSGK